MACVARGNEFVQSSQPWALAKNPETRAQLESVLAAIMRQLARHAIHLAPFMPTKAQELWEQLGGRGRSRISVSPTSPRSTSRAGA